jgi:hypothetical protein
VTYKTALGLGDWIYCTLYVHTTGDYRQLQRHRYSAHFPVYRYARTRMLKSSLVVSWQLIYHSYHCHFRSHMKSSLHGLIPFLALILRLPVPKTRLYAIPSSYPGSWRPETGICASRLLDYCSLLLLLRPVFCVLL